MCKVCGCTPTLEGFSKNESIKAKSDHLRGRISDELTEETPAFTEESEQLLKFHGIYMIVRSGLPEVAAVLARAVGGARPAAVISNATLPNERKVSGPVVDISRLADQAGIGAPAVLVVGDLVAAIPMLSELRLERATVAS